MEQVTLSKAEYDKLLADISYKNRLIEELNKQTVYAYSVKEVSNIMNIGEVTTRQLIDKGYLPSVKVGNGEKVFSKYINNFFEDFKFYDMTDLDNIKKRKFI